MLTNLGKIVDNRSTAIFFSSIFQNLHHTGEKLTEEEIDTVTQDCMDPENENGLINYVRKYLVIRLLFQPP